MVEKIDTRISPAIDGELIRLMDGYTEETAKFVGGVASFFDVARQTLSKIHEARTLWQSNPAVTKEGAIVIVAKEAQSLQTKVLQRYDQTAQGLEANIAHTEAQLAEPIVELASRGPVNAEVRSYARGLNTKERNAFMREALESGDEATLAAVLGAQPFLSGLTPLDREHFLREYHTRKRPDLVQRLDVMRKALERLHDSKPILFKQFEKAVGASMGDAAALMRRDDAAKAALKINLTA